MNKPNARRIALILTALAASPLAPPPRAEAEAASDTAPATAPTTRPGKLDLMALDPKFVLAQRKQRDKALDQYAGLDKGGTFALDALMKVTVEKGLLRIEGATPFAPEAVEVKVEGSDAFWVIDWQQPQRLARDAAGGIASATVSTCVVRLDLDVKDDDEVWATYVTAGEHLLSIIGHSVNARVMYAQTNNSINLTVMEWAPAPDGVGLFLNSKISARAPTLDQLRANEPAAFRTYMLPLLGKIMDASRLGPGPTNVYTAFPDIPAGDEALKRLQALLPKLDADSDEERTEASKRLHALGPAGVLAALRTDTSELSAEQSGRLGELVASHRWGGPADPAVARRDPSFLVGCLEFDDVAVRRAAKAALETVLGRPVNVDVEQAGDALGTAVDEVRREVTQHLATQPTTGAATP